MLIILNNIKIIICVNVSAITALINHPMAERTNGNLAFRVYLPVW